MNLNLLAYGLYFLITGSIIIKVGYVCYCHGQTYVSNLLSEQLDLSLFINKVLLAGYYLVNLGYIIYTISTWETITTFHEVITQIASHSGQILLLLAFLHYMNILGIHLFFNKQQSVSNN